MSRKRTLLAIFGVGLVVGVLLAGCTLPAAPDVTPTPSQQEINEAGMAQMATEIAQQGTAEAMSPVPTPTPQPTTPPPTPTPLPTIPPTVPPTPLPTTPPPTQPTETPTAPSQEQVYIVQPGDTLYSIARRYGVRLEDLAAYNGIINPNLIYVGQQIRIPAGSVVSPPTEQPAGEERIYIVQPGDRLFRIALRYNMNYLYLAAYNGIANPNLIYPGQVIRIPPAP
ncbi:MAG TPA: LysM peptidoglycan-binding domain-containing protein [Thermoflexia bacterium]|nr:LysM peptidoglycan-binding domain-containing protein [Thermoflexia bacterium]